VEYDDAGNPVRLRGIQTDITEHKQSEQALAQARERLRQIIDLIPDPLYVKNRDDEVVLSNVANAELHGLTREEIEGSREREVEADVENIENFDTYRQRELAVMETGEAMTFEEALTDPAGEDHVFRTTRIPFTAAGNDEDAVLGYARDVTPLKEYEQELEATKRDLEDTNRKLDQFAGIVSHDLRNPLSVILGYAEDMDVDDDTQSKVDAIRRSATRMEDMIEDLLVLSRLGQEIEDTETVSLRSVVEESWENVRHSGSSLELDVPRSVTLDADRDRLLNVFENLFRNAAEHNEPPVTIHVGVIEGETDSDERPVAGFFVADDGTGIPDATAGDIFEHGYTTNRDGTGFGLSIVEAVVDAHDWRVSVSDSRNGGARFAIRTATPE
jgi:PAS domain S-box-containing protein